MKKESTGVVGRMLIIMLIIAWYGFVSAQASTYSTCNEDAFNKLRDMEGIVKAIETIQSNLDMVNKQLEVLTESKIMKVGMTQAFELLSNDTELISDEFNILFEKTKNELIQIVQIEQELKIKKRVLEISEAIISNKDETIRSSFLNKMSYTFREEKCKCFDVISGNLCDRAVSNVEVTETKVGKHSVLTLSDSIFLPKSCKDYHDNYNNGSLVSGVYLIRPRNDIEPFTVFCDMRGGWTFMNGIASTFTPNAIPIPPILPSVVNSVEFQAVLSTVTEVKSSLGDRCVVDIKNSEVKSYGDLVMNNLCRGVSYFNEGISFIKYYAK